MPGQHYRSPHKPLRSDDEIISYFMGHPQGTVEHARVILNCSFKRAARLKAIALKKVEAMKFQKKRGDVDWRELFHHTERTKELRHKASWSQDFAVIDLQKKFKVSGPVVIQPISDLHIGSLATNHYAIEEITDGLLTTPNYYWILNGDLTETTAVFKNALAVHSQSMDIEMQHAVLESWLKTIEPKVLSAGWDNHGVEREEKHGAFSHIKQLLNRRFVYHNGMGRIDIKHGKAIYKLLVSHKIAGYSIFNHLHGAKRILRLEFPDVDIAITGDKHTPDFETYYEGEFKRCALMGGSFKVDDGYSKRYFSLFTQALMPAFVLYPDQKWFGCYMTTAEALAVAKGLKEPPRF